MGKEAAPPLDEGPWRRMGMCPWK